MPVDVSQFDIRFQPILLTSSSIRRVRRCVAGTPVSGRSGELLFFCIPQFLGYEVHAQQACRECRNGEFGGWQSEMGC